MNSRPLQTTTTTQLGFTLLEVMMALVVLAFGLMGLAGLQATGIKNNNSAYYRSVAAQYAAEISDRMRANAAVDYSTITAATHTSCKSVTGCTTTEMAENDLKEWTDGLAGSLPLGNGTVTPIAVSNPDKAYVVSIFWDDERSGSAPITPNFKVNVRP